MFSVDNRFNDRKKEKGRFHFREYIPNVAKWVAHITNIDVSIKYKPISRYSFKTHWI